MKLRILAIYVALIAVAIFALRRAQHLSSGREGVSPAAFHIYAMSDYFPEEFLTDFQSRTHCQLTYDNFSNNEELLAKLQAGASGYDVIVPADYMLRALIEGHYVQELDKSRIPNLTNIATDFRGLPYDPEGKYTVPYTWGTTGVIYNSKYIKDPITSWQDLFKPEYSGHISLLDDEREVLGAMLHKLGYSINSVDKAELEQAQKLLISLKSNVRIFASDPKQHLLSEDIWIAQIYSGDAEQLIKSKAELRYVVPAEGGTLWVDNLAISSRAQNLECAYAFINEVLGQSAAQLITAKLLYSSPNGSIEKDLTQERLKPSYLQKLKGSRLEFLHDLGPDSQKWNLMWTEAKLQ